MENLSGLVSRIIFRNEENWYTVFELAVFSTEGAAGSSDMVCVGNFPLLNEGENVSLQGEYTDHPAYGIQFLVKEYEVSVPKKEAEILRYLGSGAIKGIREALARRIVKRFGEDTFRVIEEEPERLAEIKGITEKKAREIAVQFAEKYELRQAMLFLQQYGISNLLATKIYQRYGEGLYQILSENPYQLAEDIEGVGFKTADEIALKAGISQSSDHRLRCGVLYALKEALSDGHCYLPKDLLIQRSQELLFEEEREELAEVLWIQIKNLSMDKHLFIKEQNGELCVYDASFYYLELKCAKRLHDLNIDLSGDERLIAGRLKRLEETNGITLEEKQKTAVIKAITSGISIITGGPGTGKTTIINMILKYFEGEKAEILLCAPTGRAAKRMTEATGYEASTIQRLLHLTPYSLGADNTGASSETLRNGFYYEKNENDPLEADVVIVDEMSMVDISLFSALLRAILPGTRLVMAGDIDQLPSVGPGAVLKDLIQSGCFADSTVILDKIFRQAEESDIIVNAHKINRGEHIRLDNKSRDFFFLERAEINQILKNIVILIRDKLPCYVNAKPFDIQVLTPMKKGALGVESLNPILQKYLNPPTKEKKEIESQGQILREGDKVMQVKNNYQLVWEIKSRYGIVVDRGEGIFNGDTGIIVSINAYDEAVVVEYDGGRRVNYPFSGLSELTLSYAVTIHKSQGSEYPAVVIPILSGPRLLFYRNLLYTGVTRATDCVVLLGSRKKIEEMIDNADEKRRYTGLAERLKEIWL